MQAAPQDYRNVPIDIQTSKLLDWLLDRRHCGRRWPAQVAQVRERIRAALQDMPEHPEIRELLQGSYLHYFHCLRIVEILKGTEASTKNLFGRYSSQRMKNPLGGWNSVPKLAWTGMGKDGICGKAKSQWDLKGNAAPNRDRMGFKGEFSPKPGQDGI
uniref:Uncharacterized protein n=1 Tax=Geospiza parvula TaxID=87175 RepID=A0A8U8BDK0_GEOPR